MGFGTLGAWQSDPADAHFQGDLDEAPINHTVLTADWHKLSFENQKPDARLVEFRGN